MNEVTLPGVNSSESTQSCKFFKYFKKLCASKPHFLTYKNVIQTKLFFRKNGHDRKIPFFLGVREDENLFILVFSLKEGKTMRTQIRDSGRIKCPLRKIEVSDKIDLPAFAEYPCVCFFHTLLICVGGGYEERYAGYGAVIQLTFLLHVTGPFTWHW